MWYINSPTTESKFKKIKRIALKILKVLVKMLQIEISPL